MPIHRVNPARRLALESPWLPLALVAVAFGIVEGSLVTVLRLWLDPRAEAFPLVALPAAVSGLERTREAATMVLLASAAHLAAKLPSARFAAFLFLFSVWDLVYYATLRLTLGWPDGLGTWDLLFLLPVPWLAPVYAPLSIALVMLGVGIVTLRHTLRHGAFEVRPLHVAAGVLGGLACIWSFVENENARALRSMPPRYAIEWLVLGLGLGLAGFADAARRNRRRVRRGASITAGAEA